MPKGIRKGKSPELIKSHYKSRDIYRFYKTIIDKEEKKNGFNVPYQLFNDIRKEFNIWMSNRIIHNAKGIELPFRLGRLNIVKYKVSPYITKDGVLVKEHLPINWDATIKLWENDLEAKKNKVLIRELNEHTDGYVHCWKWDRFKSNIKNKSVYYFIPTRTNTINLKNELKKENKIVDYYEKYERKKKKI